MSTQTTAGEPGPGKPDAADPLRAGAGRLQPARVGPPAFPPLAVPPGETHLITEIPWYDQISPRQREMCPRCHAEQPVYAQLSRRDNGNGGWMWLRCYICNTPVREFWNLSGKPPREVTPERSPAPTPRGAAQLGLFAPEETT
jgi:hypothetical protein